MLCRCSENQSEDQMSSNKQTFGEKKYCLIWTWGTAPSRCRCASVCLRMSCGTRMRCSRTHSAEGNIEICHFLYGHYAKFWNLWRYEQPRAGDHARQPLRYDYLRHCVQCQRWMPYVLTRWNERVLVGRLTVFPSCPCSAERRQTFAPGCSWFFFQQWSATKRIVPRAVSIINRTCIETRKSLFGISIRLTTPCCCKCGDFQVRGQRQKHKKNYFWNL